MLIIISPQRNMARFFKGLLIDSGTHEASWMNINNIAAAKIPTATNPPIHNPLIKFIFKNIEKIFDLISPYLA